MFVPTRAAGWQPTPSRAYRWLNAFTTVKPGEARGALRLAANVFCLLRRTICSRPRERR